jgi:hypothetical protein
VHRHVEGGEPLLLDALPIRRREVGEGEIGAVEEAQAKIIILEIEGAPMARWLLIDEAKGAVVVALPEAIEESLAKHQPQSVVCLLFEFNHMKAPPGIFHFEAELLLPTENL